MEAATLGALFLLSLFVPAYTADSTIVAEGTNTPLLVVAGIGSAAGVGALLVLTGHAIWNFVWPYSPTGGWKQFLPFARGSFRSEIAPTLGEYWQVADRACGPGGDRAIVATAFLLYSEAPEQVREWIRRRYGRFVDALSAAAAIVLGVASGAVVYSTWNWGRWVLVILFVAVALVSVAHGWEGRQEAVAMERYWFAVRADNNLPPKPPARVALERGSEVVVRPGLPRAAVRQDGPEPD